MVDLSFLWVASLAFATSGWRPPGNSMRIVQVYQFEDVARVSISA